MATRVVKLTESDLSNLVKKVLREQELENYMTFSNLEQIRRQADMLLSMDHGTIDKIIQDGHDWADDHISEAKNNVEYEDIQEGKKAGTKLCARGKSAAKSKFKVYPSAYANGYAVQVCKGKIKGLDGKKQCSGSYC
jgi:hypothetical protein